MLDPNFSQSDFANHPEQNGLDLKANREKKPSSQTPIALFSADTLQADCFRKMLAEALSTPVAIHKSVYVASELDFPKSSLAILDFQHIKSRSATLVHNLLQYISSTNGKVVVINLPAHVDKKTWLKSLFDYPVISGLFYTDACLNHLVNGIQQVLQGELWIGRELLQHLIDRYRETCDYAPALDRSRPALTRREREVLEGIRLGNTNAEIADQLNLSEHTIKSHLKTLYKKLNARNRAEAIAWSGR